MGKNFTIEESGYPDMPKMMLATIEALREIGDSASLHELDEQVAKNEGLTESERSITTPNGKFRKFNYYQGWSRTFLKQGGALDNSKRGVWALTAKGKEIISAQQTHAIFTQAVAEARERTKRKKLAEEQAQKEKKPEIFDGDPTVDWKSELLDSLQGMDPSAFERLAQRLLREAGFSKVEVIAKTGDGGLDGVGALLVKLVSFQIFFQCKRWKGSVGAKEIRDFRGALQGRADKGLFITTGTFTSQASDEAERDGAIAIDLIDGERLCDLLKDYNLGVQTEMVEKITISKDFFKDI